MNKIDSLSWQSRSIGILIPLFLLSICSWALCDSNTPNLPAADKNFILNALRVFFPCLFAISVAFLLQVNNRPLQLSVVVLVYAISLYVIKKTIGENYPSPILASIAACCSILAMIPGNIDNTKKMSFRHIFDRYAPIDMLMVIILPVITLTGLILFIIQINAFILFTFTETFSLTIFSALLTPLFVILQSLGAQNFISELMALKFQNDNLSAFINAIIITNCICIPATLISRAYFAKNSNKLFLVSLAICCLLSASNGISLALILLIFIVFYPGSFLCLLISSLCIFLFSKLLEIKAIADINIFYNPDLHLNGINIYNLNDNTAILSILGFCIPLLLVCVVMILKSDHNSQLKQRRRLAFSGYNATYKSSAELRVLAFLRALGGISNIRHLQRKETTILAYIHDDRYVLGTLLHSICLKRASYDKVRKCYKCEIGDNAYFIYMRLIKLIGNTNLNSDNFIELAPEFNISTSIDIKQKSKYGKLQ